MKKITFENKEIEILLSLVTVSKNKAKVKQTALLSKFEPTEKEKFNISKLENKKIILNSLLFKLRSK